MKLSSFEDEFDSRLLGRGEKYFDQQRVQELVEEEKGIWTASVWGSEDYNVQIEIAKQGTITSYFCDCPHTDPLCKHIAAVLFAIRQHSSPKSKTPVTKKTKLSFQGLLNKLTAEELHEFIAYYGKKDKTFKGEFEVYFGHKDENFNLAATFRQNLKKLIKRYERHDFIDYQASNKLGRELIEFLNKIQIDVNRGNLLDASTQAMIFIQEVMPIIAYSDDSNGYITDTIYDSESILEEIALNAPYSLKEKIMVFLREELVKDIYFEYGDFGYHLTDIYQQLCASCGKQDEFLQYIDAKIEGVHDDMGEYLKHSFIKRKIAFLIQIERRQQAEQLMQKYLDLPDIRELLIQERIDQKRYEEAKELIPEGIRLAELKKHPGIVQKWETKLLHIAELENDTETVRKLTAKFAFQTYIDLEYYRKLKSLYTPEQWDHFIVEKIAELKKSINSNKSTFGWDSVAYAELLKLGPIYVEEKMHEQLFALVKQQEQFETAYNYHDILSKKYGAELIALYLPLFELKAKEASDRSAYREIMAYIKTLTNDMPAARSPFIEQLLNWKIQYKNRPAMLDEISKVLKKLDIQ